MIDRKNEHPDDALLIDFLTGNGSEQQVDEVAKRLKSDPELARRSARISDLLKLLDHVEAPEPSEELVARTVAAATSAGRTNALLAREASRARSIGGATFTLKELGAVAALFFLVAAILLPSFRKAGQLAGDQACMARVGEVGAALRGFALANNNRLPALGEDDANWLDRKGPSVRSNSQNLWKLVKGQYAQPSWFQCPAAGDPKPIESKAAMVGPDFPAREFISYSYHNAVNAQALRIDAGQTDAAAMAVLADRTPVFQDGRFRPEQLDSNSPNHEYRGQAVLYLDMHVVWARRSQVGVDGDNIWLVQGVHTYRGNERPANENDSFLLPSYIETSGQGR